ncbi:YfjI family protein [Mesorhizobium sp. M1060]|uniref:DUF3987 domain-containing protein n=1 Tax=Mesorhizobium sp. M1060 TaxID=2957052 RepID=UPI00333BBCEE
MDRLIAGGYLPMLRPCAPPGVARISRDKATGALVEKVSDGKVPSSYRDGRWGGLKGWPDLVPSPQHIEEWRQWPDPNWCLVAGDIGVFDLDIKIAPAETGPAANRARRLVEETKFAIAHVVGIAVEELPLRWRANSTSCAIFVRLAQPCGKKILHFIDTECGDRHAVEFLARGQQIVVAGLHDSGAEIRSTLVDTPLARLPSITPGELDAIIAAISSASAGLGFTPQTPQEKLRHDNKPPYRPHIAVLRAVMSRRAEWVPNVLPIVAGAHAEWRVSGAELDRELEEDIAVYPNGIYDHGTRREHTPASLIAEFGAIGADGEITFGGSPIYGPDGAEEFAVAGEPDPSIRRPSESQALTWLCRMLAGDHFPAFAEGATWTSSLHTIGRAVGLRWRALEAARWFEFAEGDGPGNWRTDKLLEKADTLAALEAVDPEEFARIEFFNDMKSEPADLRKIIDDRRTAITAMSDDPGTPKTTEAADTPPEPFDIFAQNDPVDLSTLPPNCLPEMLQRWVRSESRRKGTPESFAAIAAVAVAAAAIGTSARIQVRKFDTGFTQPAGLWACIVAPPGSAKSPIIKAAEKPLRSLDSEWHRVWKLTHDAWEASSQAYKSRRKDAPPPGPEPVQHRCVVDDVTLEKQVQLHAHNPRGLLRTPDEFVSLLGSLGAYKRTGDADRGQMLRLFDGGAISVDRVSGGSIRADSALMTVIASSQPQKIAEVARNLGADGMLQRFTFILDDDVDRRGIDEPPDEEAAVAYNMAIRLLASSQPDDPAPIRMAPDAQVAFDTAAEQIVRLKSAPGLPTAEWEGHVAKFEMILSRIVLVFHGLEAGFRSSHSLPPMVSLDTVAKAVLFGRFVLRHSMAFYSRYFEPNVEATDARGFAGYLLTKPDLATVSRRAVGEARTDLRGPNRRRLFAAMAELETANWVAVNKRDHEGPSEWRVNARIHQRFEAQAEREKAERASRRKAIAAAGEVRKWVNSDKSSTGGDHDG